MRQRVRPARVARIGLLIAMTAGLAGCPYAPPVFDNPYDPNGSDYARPLTPLSLTGAVTTIAGGPGADTFFQPQGLCAYGDSLYIADTYNYRIRRLAIGSGVVTTLAGSGRSGQEDGIGTKASFFSPTGLCTDGDNLYVADSRFIRKIVIATGAVSTLARNLWSAHGITIYGRSLYFTNTYNYTIERLDLATGAITVIAGGNATGSVDGSGANASFNRSVAITTDGTFLYVVDIGSNLIRKVAISSGRVTTIAGTGNKGYADGKGTAAAFNEAYGIATDGKSLYIADSANNLIRELVISSGVVTTLAGSFGNATSLDGKGPSAGFRSPMGIAVSDDYLYVSDANSNTIRKIE